MVGSMRRGAAESVVCDRRVQRVLVLLLQEARPAMADQNSRQVR
jgi:hypothetical protein